MTFELDRAWLRAHPLPDPNQSTDKNSRGRVLVVGGSRSVPGGIQLTAEAALRSGAGKVRIATIAEAAMAIGVLVPEAAVTALPADADGEIAEESAPILREKARACDAMVIGPAMGGCAETERLMENLFSHPDPLPPTVLDAGALTCARDLAPMIARRPGRVVLTPHHGEMARVTGAAMEEVAADAPRFAREAALRFGAVVLLKGPESWLAAPGEEPLHFAGGAIGLGTGGSGDVLAGVIGGLAARGVAPHVAAAWGCWLHAEAGRVLTARMGTVGFLARELLPVLPGLLDAGPAMNQSHKELS